MAGNAASQLALCLFAVLGLVSAIDVDPKGYILFCPCMGRFGNQAEHFLGVFAFAKGLDRTLVLPPWVEYVPGQRNSVQVPFDTYFKVSAVAEYTKVITMESFMRDLAPVIWPPEKRLSYCYSERRGAADGGCNAKEGNPFGPFWDTFSIDFVGSEFHRGLSYSTQIESARKQWENKFPVKSHMVLAFTGAPAAFPIQQPNVDLQRYLVWSDAIDTKAETFIQQNLKRPFLGIHMRNGIDWERACEHANDESRNLFGSAQCLGFNLEHGKLTQELCFPTEKTVIKQVKDAVKKLKAEFVFVAADHDHMISRFQKAMKKVTFVKQPQKASPHLDLAILAKADHYIGNCVSTFSHFATRERRVAGKTVEFWAFESEPRRDEL